MSFCHGISLNGPQKFKEIQQKITNVKFFHFLRICRKISSSAYLSKRNHIDIMCNDPTSIWFVNVCTQKLGTIHTGGQYWHQNDTIRTCTQGVVTEQAGTSYWHQNDIIHTSRVWWLSRRGHHIDIKMISYAHPGCGDWAGEDIILTSKRHHTHTQCVVTEQAGTSY